MQSLRIFSTLPFSLSVFPLLVMSKITIYTTPYCVYCKMAKEFFKKNDVAYEEKDVIADEQARNDMITKSGQLGVPVIEIDGKIVIGFDQGRLKELLGKQ